MVRDEGATDSRAYTVGDAPPEIVKTQPQAYHPQLVGCFSYGNISTLEGIYAATTTGKTQCELLQIEGTYLSVKSCNANCAGSSHFVMTAVDCICIPGLSTLQSLWKGTGDPADDLIHVQFHTPFQMTCSLKSKQRFFSFFSWKIRVLVTRHVSVTLVHFVVVLRYLTCTLMLLLCNLTPGHQEKSK